MALVPPLQEPKLAFEMDAGSSSSGAASVPAPQTMSKLVGPPYRKRAKNAVLNDPGLEGAMGSMERALDAEEFPEASPLSLDDEEKEHWTRLRKVLFDEDKADRATQNLNPRSFASELAHVRQTLRMLQDVAAGVREKFSIRGCQPKRASRIRRSKANTTATATKVSKVVKAKRAKSTTTQHINSIALSSSSAAAQADDEDADVMDYAPIEAVVDDSAQEIGFETAEERVQNDDVLRMVAEEIREEHPALRAVSPDTMRRIGHLVDMGLW